jgi:hypothetical protein
MARAMTWILDIREWPDGVAGEWVAHLQDLLGTSKNIRVGIEILNTQWVKEADLVILS